MKRKPNRKFSCIGIAVVLLLCAALASISNKGGGQPTATPESAKRSATIVIIANTATPIVVSATSTITPTQTPRPAAIVKPTIAPAAAPQYPAGTTAICKDGTYSSSQHRSGTCSKHGGVQTWLVNVP